MARDYKILLRSKMDAFVDAVFVAAAQFPREEMYVTTAQLKRAALSVVLNYCEGYARMRPRSQLHFMEIAYGSLVEAQYLINFSERQKFLNPALAARLRMQADEIGAMLWTEIDALRNTVEASCSR